ncbi:MAG: DUF4336 domain-containing protein [Proteobacteria bacterium]|nr:DUF4336 domain-containing protein [Pseudomonadota bacterium]
MHGPCRCTLIEVQPGELLIYSPVPCSEQDVRNIEKFGKVQWMVAPNTFHHLWVSRAQRQFIEAQTYVTNGVATKQPRLAHAGILPTRVPDAWCNTLEMVHILTEAALTKWCSFTSRPTPWWLPTWSSMYTSPRAGWLPWSFA